MILLIDNYDSFVHNIARHFECAGESCMIVRNDALTVNEVANLNPSAIVISPGPCAPEQAGISVEVIKKLGHAIPILGICLGHQCIGAAYGAQIIQVPPMHGMASIIKHDEMEIFSSIPQSISDGRYHSLAVEIRSSFWSKSPLRVTAQAKDGLIMAMRHKKFPVYGVQFHPESILTEYGMQMIENFLIFAARHNALPEKIAA